MDDYSVLRARAEKLHSELKDEVLKDLPNIDNKVVYHLPKTTLCTLLHYDIDAYDENDVKFLADLSAHEDEITCKNESIVNYLEEKVYMRVSVHPFESPI